MRSVLATVGLAFVILALGSAIAAADYNNGTFDRPGTPFGGIWNSYNWAPPSNHHRAECEASYMGTLSTKPTTCTSGLGYGDWATDFYGTSRPIIYVNNYSPNTVTARVWNVIPTCKGPGGASIAGSTVFVDIYTNGDYQSWQSFGHLRTLQVVPGQWLTPSQVLGYTVSHATDWNYLEGCWEVRYDNGVHTHMEEWNNYNFACYWPWGAGTYLDYNNAVGEIGRTNKTDPGQPCY